MSAQQESVPVSAGGNAESLLSVALVSCHPVTLVAVRGEVDISTAHLLTEIVNLVASNKPSRVTLDLAEVCFFGADGLRALLSAQRTIAAAGGQLLLRDPSPITHRILALTQTEQLFQLDTTLTPSASVI
jgi:anti-anti-sigma factor